MSYMFLDDVIRSIFEISLAHRACIQSHAYNLHEFHFTAKQLGEKLKQFYPSFEYSFDAYPDVESMIIGWPDEVLSTSIPRIGTGSQN